MRLHFSGQCLALTLLLAFSATNSRAQTAEEFYRGKSIELDIGFGSGGAYDTYARVLAHSFGKYIPGNPTIVPRNFEGAGSMRLANYLYNAAPRDGTVIGTISRGTVFEPLFGDPSAQFDGTKFGWIGSANNEVSVCVAWHTSGFATFEDARARSEILGASGRAADSYQFPKIANAVLGTKFQIVTGYPGGNEIDLAMERGEVQGRCGWSWTALRALHPDWLAQHKLNILFQMGLTKHPELPNVPLIVDLANSGADKSILSLVFARQVMAWPYLAPPGVPADRVEALRQAFWKTMQDHGFQEEADRAKLEVRPVSGADAERLVRDVYGTPSAIISKTTEFLH